MISTAAVGEGEMDRDRGILLDPPRPVCHSLHGVRIFGIGRLEVPLDHKAHVQGLELEIARRITHPESEVQTPCLSVLEDDQIPQIGRSSFS